MDIEFIARLFFFGVFFLIIIVSNAKKGKGASKSNRGSAAGKPTASGKSNEISRKNSSAFTAKEMREEHTNLSGKIHSREHTHDRLDFDCYVPENPAEHYKKQLDGFLHTGLIEKEEYQEITRRYREQGIL